jgi:hypothetical protein
MDGTAEYAAGMPDPLTLALALRDAKATRVCHVTPAANLLDIAASQALLAPALRGVTPAHGWGANQDAAQGSVCLSFWPSWGLINSQFPAEEAVVLEFDALQVPGLPTAVFCPGNAAEPKARRFVTGKVDQLKALRQCISSAEVLLKAEILVPGEVPLTALRAVVFGDAEAKEAWSPPLQDLLAAVGLDRVRLSVSQESVFPWLPPDLAVSARMRPIPVGVDRRVRPVETKPALAPEQLEELDEEDDGGHWMDDEDWDEPEEDEGPSSWADFYDDGEPDDPDFYELSVKD